MKAPLLVRFFDKFKLPDLRKNSARPKKPVVLTLEQLEDRTLMSSLAVVDVNTNVVLPSNATPINSFSNWAMSLQAQVSGLRSQVTAGLSLRRLMRAAFPGRRATTCSLRGHLSPGRQGRTRFR